MKLKPILLSAILLCSCNLSEKKSKIPVFSFYDRKKEELCLLTKSELDEMKENKSSFVLYVYAGGCNSCDAFGYVIKDYIKEYESILFTMNLEDYLKTDNSLSLSESTLLFVSQGKNIDYTSDFSSIGSKKELHSYLERYVSFTNVSILNETVETQSDSPFETYRFAKRIHAENLQEDRSYLFLFPSLKDYSFLNDFFLNQNVEFLILPLEDYASFSFLDFSNSYQYCPKVTK